MTLPAFLVAACGVLALADTLLYIGARAERRTTEALSAQVLAKIEEGRRLLGVVTTKEDRS